LAQGKASGRRWVWKKAQKRPHFTLKNALQLLSHSFLNVYCKNDRTRSGVFDLDQ
jgi:hypothetical protein